MKRGDRGGPPGSAAALLASAPGDERLAPALARALAEFEIRNPSAAPFLILGSASLPLMRAIAAAARSVIVAGIDPALLMLARRALTECGLDAEGMAVRADPAVLPFRESALGAILVALAPGEEALLDGLRAVPGGAPLLLATSSRVAGRSGAVLAEAAGRALVLVAPQSPPAPPALPPPAPPTAAPPTARPAPSAAAISVVITTRDRAAFLTGAIASARRQDAPPAEILVVDDGSRDDTPRLLAELGAHVRSIRHATPRGQAAAMNAALHVAAGDWIAWLDDDDYFLPAKLRLQSRILADPEVGLAVTAHYIADPAGRPLEMRLLPHFTAHEVLRLLLRGSIFLGPTALVRRAAYEAMGTAPYDETLPRAADYAMWWRLARRWRVAVLQVPLSVIRRHPGNALDAERARLIHRSVRATLEWVRAEVPLAEIAGPDADEEDHIAVRFERARAFLRAGLLAAARADLEVLRAADLDQAENLLGLIALAGRDWPLARDLFAGVLRRAPRNHEAANGLATAQLLGGDRVRAAATLERALVHAPGDPLLRYNLALTAAADPAHPQGPLALARDLLAERGVRGAHYSPAPPVRGLDAHFLRFRSEPAPT